MRVLVVEDEERIARFLGTGLRAEGYVTSIASDGASALTLVSREEPDVVILDLRLPDRDGIEVLEEIRSRHPDALVIVLSARRDIPTRLTALRGGAVDFVPKPFAFEELLARISIHTRHARAGNVADMLKVGHVALDARRRRVDFGRGPVALTDLEYRLLETLARHRGDTVSRERLLAAVWGYTHKVQTNIVDVSVRRLRHKVGYELIETVRNAGYRLAVEA